MPGVAHAPPINPTPSKMRARNHPAHIRGMDMSSRELERRKADVFRFERPSCFRNVGIRMLLETAQAKHTTRQLYLTDE